MTAHREGHWTLDELGARVATALSVDYTGPANGQIRALPDRRTIRYYTTLGLVDRPAEMRGRTALYGRRHLLQIVAIKRLQSRGFSLVEIQQKLLGLGDKVLERLAQLPGHDAATPETPAAPGTAEPADTAAFWTALPAPVRGGEAGQENAEAKTEPGSREAPATNPPESRPGAGEGVVPLQGVPLAEDITLLLPAVRPIDEDDLQAIRLGAAPLLKLLEKRRLLRPAAERNTP
jgi:hypothetical protein